MPSAYPMLLMFGPADVVATLTAGSIVAVVATWAFFRILPRSTGFRRSGVLLGEATAREVGYISAPARAELVGQTGVAVTDLRPAGTARIGDERVDVVADGEWIPAGAEIRIVAAEGYRQLVRRVAEGA